MDASRLLLLVVVVTSTCEWKSEVSGCEDSEKQKYHLLEGEAFYFVPDDVMDPNDGEFTWFKSSPQSRNISSNETERVHYHGGALFFFDILPTDAGIYTCQEISPTGECFNYCVEIYVFNKSFPADEKLMYGAVNDADDNKEMTCPSVVSYTCKELMGNFTWYKDFILLPGKHEENLWVENVSEDDEGIYTCICTWRHNHKVYNSSGSRRLIHQEVSGCEDSEKQKYHLLEGEAFYFVPDDVMDPNDGEFTWFKSSPQSRNISSNETERVHYHGGALFFFDILPTDAGIYTCQEISPTGECFNYCVEIYVFNKSFPADEKLMYGAVNDSDDNKEMTCPSVVSYTCKELMGNFTWYKDFILLPGKHEENLWVENVSEDDEGIYTCICTWRHNHKVYNSSGSRRLIHQEKKIFSDPEILSPINKVQFADEGHEIKLNCSVNCGKNARRECNAGWNINEIPVVNMDSNRYLQTTNLVVENPSKNTIATSILTIKKVSAEDFEDKFECFVTNFYRRNTTTLTLQQRASIVPLVVRGVCVLFFFVFAALLVKFFAIDLALFFRPYLPLSKHNEDKRIYDAFVVYQMQKKDKATEESLSRFLTEVLPSVLEKKCGYRLFIHGRDDIPGEDRVEMVEDCMKQSRRLMVILTPGSESEITDQSPASPQTAVVGGFDWQVGLHHALIQREMSVILIQLGDTGPQGYTNFPPGLQHLILKSAPLRWPEGSRGAAAWNSRFWKRVRYLMPVTPAKKRTQAAIV